MQSVSSKKRRIGLLSALLATMFWGSNYPISRLLFNASDTANLDELWAAWLKIFLGVVIFLPFTFTIRNGAWGTLRTKWKHDWKMFLFLSVCVVGEAMLCFIAMKYTTGARASLMANTSPIFTLVISVLAAREFLTKRKTAGMILGFIGIVLAAFSKGGDMFSAGGSMITGDLIALLSGVFWALFTVYGSAVASRYNGAFCTTVYRICGLFMMLPVLWIAGSDISFSLPAGVWIRLIYLSIFSEGVAIWLWTIAQKSVEPGVLGSFGYLSAFCAIAFTFIFLGERITWNFIAAFCLILGGLALVIRRKRS